MRTGRPANTALGIGSALSRGVQGFFDRYYQAKQMKMAEEQAKLAGELGRGKLDISKANTVLRGGELGAAMDRERGQNRRFDQRQKFDEFRAFSGTNAAENPTAYGEAYGALQNNDAAEFVRLSGLAHTGAQQGIAKQKARISGAQASASARARAEVDRLTGEEAHNTARLDAGEIQQLPPGQKVRHPLRRAGKTQADLALDSDRRLGEDVVKKVRQAAIQGLDVPDEMLEDAAGHLIKTSPQLKAKWDGVVGNPDGEDALLHEIYRQLGHAR